MVNNTAGTTHGADTAGAARDSAGSAGTDNTQVKGVVVSATPGRLRVRVHPSHRHTHLMGRLQSELQSRPGVQQVNVNPATGSLLVQYDQGEHPDDSVLELLHDVGLVFHGVMDEGELGEEVPFEPGHSTAASNVIQALDHLDQRISRLAGRNVDLKLLVPLGVGTIGLLKIIRDGVGFAEIPGYILIWYAFDMFYKFHTVNRAGANAGTGADVPPAANAGAAVAAGPG